MSISSQSIHQVIYNFKALGRNISELEGLLIHSDDFVELVKLMSQPNMVVDSSTSIILHGVKIISSRHAAKGKIFKVFKNDNQLYSPLKMYHPECLISTRDTDYMKNTDNNVQQDV